MTVRLQKNGKMKFEKITPGTIAAKFCPLHTLYSWSYSQFDDGFLQFADVYNKMIEGFGGGVQWDRDSLIIRTMPKDLDNLWWVSHQTNSIYLTTEKQLIYCELVFGNIQFLEVEYGE